MQKEDSLLSVFNTLTTKWSSYSDEQRVALLALSGADYVSIIEKHETSSIAALGVLLQQLRISHKEGLLYIEKFIGMLNK